jgi:hypothetical protein
MASFLHGVHGLRPEWPRRVLAVAAESGALEALRVAHAFAVRRGEAEPPFIRSEP